MSALPAPRHSAAQTPRLRVAERRRSKALSLWKRRTIEFVCVATLAFMGSSLVGNVALEQVRQEDKSLRKRLIAIKEYQAELQRQVIALTSVNSIEDWAHDNGFVASSRASESSERNNRVALNR